ncbi:putative bifunctional diguanylate cyclase/phosphodiesterase [Devosia riboflavina]|uniref:putative bifunctional diguanylate cyclase/phosphodiesterase n=1 Tax=Devosia riboflavina TaxID=46914 RepID=UPI00068E43BE|nr:EAL domain-containing protein [Devosia riboflavina]
MTDTTKYSSRLILAYKISAAAVSALSVFWAAVFAVQGQPMLSLGQIFLTLLCLVSLKLANAGRVTTSLYVTQFALLAFVLGLCLMFDVPNGDLPRVSHLFLLPLALVGYINFKTNRSPIQAVLIGASLLGFIALSSTHYALPFAQPIADDIRIYGVWVNSIIATALSALCVYALQAEIERTDRLARNLADALWREEFELYYQPQVDRNGRRIGAEALLRWTPAGGKPISPAEFIPAAEQAGLMGRIGYWVLQQAMQTLADWAKNEETRHLTLSVNVSASQFLEDGFERSVLNLIETFGIDPTRLKIELTESVMVANPELVTAKMHVLRAVGIGMALDDFGTGYSSLGYLRQLPLTQLKIDRSFVQSMMENKRSAALVRSIVQMGLDLELDVLAEGVETREQVNFLTQNGCQAYQGFLFGRPVPLDDFMRPAAAAAA